MKDKILVLIIGILIGAVIMTCVFLVYNKSTKKNSDCEDTTNITTSDNFRNQGFPRDRNIPEKDSDMTRPGGFDRDNFKRDENSTDLDSNEDRPVPPDGIFEGEMPSGSFSGGKQDGEPPVRPEDNQNTNSEW